METNPQEDVLDMLKALADESRLTLVRLLHEREYTVGDLAERVELTEPTVSHHLAKLRQCGLITLRMAGNHRFYRTNEAGLRRFKRLIDEIELTPPMPEVIEDDPSWIDALGWNADDSQVLRDLTVNGRLTRWPTKRKSLIIVLRWLATLFEAGRLYSEPEVNTILKAVFAEDHATLRRELVDFGYVRRERGGGKYWRTPAEETETAE